MTHNVSSDSGQICWKEIFLGVGAACIGVVVFWFWSINISLIFTGISGNYFSFLLPLLGLMISATFFSLAVLFVKNKKVVYPAVCAGMGIPFFFVDATNIVIGTFVLSMALAAIAVTKIRNEFMLSRGFSASKILKQGLPLYFTIASLIVSIFYLSLLDEKKALASFLPKSAIDASFNLPIARALNLPPVNARTTVDEFLSDLLEEQLRAQGASSADVSDEERIRAVTAQRKQFSGQYDILLKGNERVADVFYSAVTNYIEKLLGPYKRYLPFAAAAAFFFAFKTLTFFLYYLTLPLIFLSIQLMIWSGVLRKEKKDIAVEELTL